MTPSKFSLWLLVAALAGCYGDASSSGPAAPAAGSAPASGAAVSAPISGPVIADEDLSAGLAGIDADQNGIRDDIDRLIAAKYAASPALRAAAQQDARSVQRLMSATSATQAVAAGDDIVRATACEAKVLAATAPDPAAALQAMGKDLVALTANTRERFDAYWHANALATGAVFRQPREPLCD